MTPHFFSLEELEDLERHLSAELNGEQLQDALVALDEACYRAQIAPLDADIRRELQRARKSERAHFTALAVHAEETARLLQIERPRWNTSDVDWAALEKALGTLIASSRIEAAARSTAPGRGRRPEKWRDDLIAVAFSVYPNGRATKARRGHFEQTIALLLGFLDREVEDVHGIILDALRRQPDPPFTAKARRQLRVVRQKVP